MQFIIIALFALHPGQETGCEGLPWTGTDAAYPSHDERLLELVSAVREASGLDLPVEVCESRASDGPYVPVPTGQMHEEADGAVKGYVHIPHEMASRLSDSVLRGIIAHELAHFAIPPTQDCLIMGMRFDAPTEEKAACEAPADVQSARWTDTTTMLRSLLALRTFLRPHLADGEVREQWDYYIALRIRALLEHEH